MVKITNKKALFNYEVKDEFEAGIQLLGYETKSIFNNNISLEGVFCIVRGNEVFLVNLNYPRPIKTKTKKMTQRDQENFC